MIDKKDPNKPAPVAAQVQTQSWAPAGPLQIECDPKWGAKPWHVTDGHNHGLGATPNEALNGLARHLAAEARHLAAQAQPALPSLPERKAAIEEVVGTCNRIPGANTWNAAELMYDLLTAQAQQPVSGDGGLTDAAIEKLAKQYDCNNAPGFKGFARAVAELVQPGHRRYQPVLKDPSQVGSVVTPWGSHARRPESDADGMASLIDAAMTEMKGIYPPLKRSDCARLIGAALAQQDADSETLDWLEEQTRLSRTGVSFDWRGDRAENDGTVSDRGWRFMRFHFVGERKPSLREAIDAARKERNHGG